MEPTSVDLSYLQSSAGTSIGGEWAQESQARRQIAHELMFDKDAFRSLTKKLRRSTATTNTAVLMTMCRMVDERRQEQHSSSLSMRRKRKTLPTQQECRSASDEADAPANKAVTLEGGIWYPVDVMAALWNRRTDSSSGGSTVVADEVDSSSSEDGSAVGCSTTEFADHKMTTAMTMPLPIAMAMATKSATTAPSKDFALYWDTVRR